MNKYGLAMKTHFIRFGISRMLNLRFRLDNGLYSWLYWRKL
ncbi:MAG: hypothetical protein ACTSPQ_17820 [Candidatus Helarchaeota archaeon]